MRLPGELGWWLWLGVNLAFSARYQLITVYHSTLLVSLTSILPIRLPRGNLHPWIVPDWDATENGRVFVFYPVTENCYFRFTVKFLLLISTLSFKYPCRNIIQDPAFSNSPIADCIDIGRHVTGNVGEFLDLPCRIYINVSLRNSTHETAA